MKFVDACADEGKDEKDDARDEVEHAFIGRAKVFFCDEQHCCCRYETDYGGAESAEDVIDEL